MRIDDTQKNFCVLMQMQEKKTKMRAANASRKKEQ